MFGSALLQSFSDNSSHKVHEKRVLDFLINYVASLSNEAVSVVLKYLTGSEVTIPDLKIVVHFNGELNTEEMVPKSNTCSASSKFSQCIFVATELENLFETLLD